MFKDKIFSIGFVTLTTCVLLTGCSGGGNATSNPGKTSGNKTSPANTVSNRTSNGTSSTSSGNSSSAGNVSSTNSSNSTWPRVQIKQIGHLPQGVEGTTLALSATGPVAVGGYTGAVSITGVYQLLPNPTSVGQLPQRTHDLAAAYMNGSLYVFGGGQATSYNTIAEVNNGKGVNVGRLSAPLSDAAAVPFTWDGQSAIAVVGGYDGSAFRQQATVFTSRSGQLQAHALFTMPTPVRYPAVTTADNHIYVAGGKTANGSLSTGIYAWSTQSGVKKVATLSDPLQKAAAFVSGNYLIVIGGKTNTGMIQRTITAYDITTGKSQVIGQLPVGLADMGYVQDGSTGYLAGGVTSASGSPTNDIWKITLN